MPVAFSQTGTLRASLSVTFLQGCRKPVLGVCQIGSLTTPCLVDREAVFVLRWHSGVAWLGQHVGGADHKCPDKQPMLYSRTRGSTKPVDVHSHRTWSTAMAERALPQDVVYSHGWTCTPTGRGLLPWLNVHSHRTWSTAMAERALPQDVVYSHGWTCTPTGRGLLPWLNVHSHRTWSTAMAERALPQDVVYSHGWTCTPTGRGLQPWLNVHSHRTWSTAMAERALPHAVMVQVQDRRQEVAVVRSA